MADQRTIPELDAALKVVEADVASLKTSGLWNGIKRIYSAIPVRVRSGIVGSLLTLILAGGLHFGGCLNPSPVDPDKPPTPVDPKPIPAGNLRVLIIEETADRTNATKVPPAQATIFTAKAVRDYCDAKCLKVNGLPEYKTIDKDQIASPTLPQVWKDMAAKWVGKPTPWIIIANDKSAYSGPLPANVADTVALLTKYGG